VYRWWYSRSLDFRYSIIPLSGCFFFTFTIWELSNSLYEKSEKVIKIKLKARIPEEFDRKNFEKFK
jgi:hypothetical protein